MTLHCSWDKVQILCLEQHLCVLEIEEKKEDNQSMLKEDERILLISHPLILTYYALAILYSLLF